MPVLPAVTGVFRRRRWLGPVVAVLAVLLVVNVVLLARQAADAPEPAATTGSAGAPRVAPVGDADAVRVVTTLPAEVFDRVGAGSAAQSVLRRTGPGRSAEDGRTSVVWVGSEHCPGCAAQRWPLLLALSRFGTFDGLGLIASSSEEDHPGTPSVTFHGATYTSPTVAFDGVETSGMERVPGGWAPLDPVSEDVGTTLVEHNRPPFVATEGQEPFIDVGGAYFLGGPSVDPGLLAGLTQGRVAAILQDPESPLALAVVGHANVLTAALCDTTDQTPAEVCTSTGVRTAARQLVRENR